jgi:hypothetical protein
MRRNGLFWGVVLVLVGGLLLLNTLGILQVNVWNVIWPIVLILIGAWIVFGVLGKGSTLEVENAAIPLEGAPQARIRIHHGAGRLNINGNAGAGNLVTGTFGGGLSYSKRPNGNGIELDMRPRWSDSWFMGMPWSWSMSRGYDWNVALNPETPMALRLETGAGESCVDLSNTQVTDLSLSTGASSTDLTLPQNAGSTRVRLEAGAASIKVHVPGGVAAHIRTQSGISSISVDQTRFLRNGNDYQSPDYATAANKADIDIQVGVGSVSVS